MQQARCPCCKDLTLEEGTICCCLFGADPCLFAPHWSFPLFTFNLNPSHLTDHSVRIIKWVFLILCDIVIWNYSFALKTVTRPSVLLIFGQHEKYQKLSALSQLLPSYISLLEVNTSTSGIHPFLVLMKTV